MKKNIFLTAILAFTTAFSFLNANAALEDYTVLRDIDKWTFNEYRYYIVKDFFRLKEHFELKWVVNKTIAESILSNAKKWYNYLPDSLINQNYFNDLKIALEKSVASPNSEVYYEDIVKKIDIYIEKVNIQKLMWNIEATPISWNAPLTTTFRARVTDPSGTIIPSTNYIWWFDNGWIKKVVWRWLSVNYTFKEEWNFSIFLDVKSNHKNKAWYTDVLPFSTRSVIEVKEKIASVIININSTPLRESEEIKFTPEEASYWLIFDATSSTPTGWAKFRRTEWDFWNGIVRKYDWDPKIERVVYSKEWNFQVILKLTTNEWKTIERKFIVAIHKPIATIQTNKEDGFIWEKFTFSARSSVNEKNLSYTWNLIDISNDKVLATKNGSVLSHVFSEKWRYNIQLKIKDAAWNEDTDTKIIYINSRAPFAEFTYSVPDKSKPNRVLLDWTKSYDPDFSDDWKLKYIWTINWEIVEIESIDSKWAIGYYTFDSIWDHSVTLEVVDLDDMNSIKQQKIKITSILSVEFFPFPRVIQRNWFVKFVATSDNARFYEWDFWDGNKKTSTSNKMEYVYEKSWTFNVKLTVKDADGNINETTKTVYVWESNAPFSVIWVDYWASEAPFYDAWACSWWAYIVDRVKTVYFKWWESLNLDGTTVGLSYTWKIWNSKYVTSKDTTFKFDELGCFPIKLTVKSDKTWAIHSTDTWIKVENLKPTLTSLNIAVQDDKLDPVVVWVSAVWASDPDWIIQSYLWYYYTDTDTEPQDFRITSLPNTTFVIPKITWNYYFVVVMRDNNDERYSSEEATSNKYFITLNGDNINTPLIDFKVNKNNLYIWEEAIFTAKVKNVLWQDITSKSEFAWDFDGDGFYDKETNIWDITHKFENSWNFYAKVRVKYKWMTNVRTIEMNVANILEPNFKYISIWDTYIFFNTSSWKFDKSSWDMWDENKVENKNYFVYTYEDGKRFHDVELKIFEWTKVKNKTIEVVKDLKNMISVKNNQWLYIVSNPEIMSWAISLDNSWDKAVIYINKIAWVEAYWIDFDVETDSDLNWTKDDDIDNKNDPSYTWAWVLEIVLNDKKTQKSRVFTLDWSGQILDSKDILINKNYVKEEDVDIDAIIFNWITEGEKEKIEKLKSYVQWLPQEHRLKAMKYIQKLQEEWFYLNEKTKVILEFEAFIDSLWVSNGTEIINLLESFLIEWQEDQSLKNMAYNVVKNLIPKELVEHDEIISNLDQIKSNPDKLEENKILWKEILEMIKDTSLISNEDKITIKTQLQVFIYWAVENIPVDVVQEVDSWESNKIISLFSSIISIIWILFGVVIFIIIWFFVWFKISNKNKNQWLQDFIIEKTSWKTGDILWELSVKEEKKDDFTVVRPVKQEVKVETPKVVEQSKTEEKAELPKEEIQTLKSDENKVPDWLRWAMWEQQEEVKQEIVETSEIEQKVPEVKEIKEEKVELPKEEILEVETKIEEEKVPDWLKGALTSDEQKVETPEIEQKVSEVPEIKEEKVELPKEEIAEVETKIEEEKVPDWLKGVITEEKLVANEDLIINESNEKEIIEETTPKKTKAKKATKQEEVKEEEKDKKSSKSKKLSSKSEELWNDGMAIPDWLKQPTEDEKKDKKDDFWTLDNALPEDDDKAKK